MFVFANLLEAIARVLDFVLTAMYWLVIIRALISWVHPDPFNPIVQFLQASTEWLLAPLRRMLPFTWKIGIDISPIIAFLIIIFLKTFLVRTLLDLSLRVG